jgi:arsenate reductase-like glutaredoxin family protein
LLKLYGSTNCPKCQIEKHKLDKQQVAYQYINVDELSPVETARLLKRTKELGIGLALPIILQD